MWKNVLAVMTLTSIVAIGCSQKKSDDEKGFPAPSSTPSGGGGSNGGESNGGGSTGGESANKQCGYKISNVESEAGVKELFDLLSSTWISSSRDWRVIKKNDDGSEIRGYFASSYSLDSSTKKIDQTEYQMKDDRSLDVLKKVTDKLDVKSYDSVTVSKPVKKDGFDFRVLVFKGYTNTFHMDCLTTAVAISEDPNDGRAILRLLGYTLSTYTSSSNSQSNQDEKSFLEEMTTAGRQFKKAN